MHIRDIFFITALTSLCGLYISCSQSEKIFYVASLIGSRPYIFSQMKDNNNNAIDSVLEKSDMLITMGYDDNLCAECYINYLKHVDMFIDRFGTDRLNCVVFLPLEAVESLAPFRAQEGYGMSHVFFYIDSDNSYVGTNISHKYTADYHMFLLDRNRKIKVVGNPVKNNEIRRLYVKTINSTLNTNLK